MLDLQKGLLPCEPINRGYFAHSRLRGVTSQGNRWEDLYTSYADAFVILGVVIFGLVSWMYLMNTAHISWLGFVINSDLKCKETVEKICACHPEMSPQTPWDPARLPNKADFWRINIYGWQLVQSQEVSTILFEHRKNLHFGVQTLWDPVQLFLTRHKARSIIPPGLSLKIQIQGKSKLGGKILH